MATNAPTIIDLKLTFLRAQILALSKPLRPSADFESSVSGEENSLRQKSIDEALNKLNGLLRKHNKLAYGPQAQRHVAEQIDELYWASGERSVTTDAEDWTSRDADYRKEEIIEKLPEEWGDEEAESRAPVEAAKYKELQSKLVQLNETRKAVKEKVQQYKAAKRLLEPFEGEDAGLQDNMVTKNGEIEKELERMRMLMLRVERGIVGLEDHEVGDEMDVDPDEDASRRLQALLGGK